MAAFQFTRKNKFGAKRVDGFPSQLERAVYYKLLDRQTLGLISDIKRQQTVVLQEGGKDVRIAWKLDFSFINNETKKTEYAEAKGFETNDYLLKLKLWRAKRPAPLEIWRGSHKYPKMVERIE